jgi:hypothetical protein
MTGGASRSTLCRREEGTDTRETLEAWDIPTQLFYPHPCASSFCLGRGIERRVGRRSFIVRKERIRHSWASACGGLGHAAICIAAQTGEGAGAGVGGRRRVR